LKLFSQLISWHDKLLARDLKRPQRQLGIPLFLVGLAAIWRGWGYADHLDKLMLVFGGFAVGLAVEKFAQYQARRVAKKLSF